MSTKPEVWYSIPIEIGYDIFGEGSQILTNQKREDSAFSALASDLLKFGALPRNNRTL